MDIVVDTSVIIEVIVNGQGEPLKKKTAGANLLAPPSVHWEIGNAFSAMLKRKRISIAQVYVALSIYQKIPIRYVDVDLPEVLELASRLGIYAYDAYVIACALNQRAPLMTLDRDLIRAATQEGIETLGPER
ncbi:MAG: type II toxin-antitoxin system VapC family toxin [Acidobacteriota bacterium]